MSDYAAFLASKAQHGAATGFEPTVLPDQLFNMHPLQLDVIERVVHLRTNPGERVLTPFMGVGSEVYIPVQNGRVGIGVELKPSYYRQAVLNLATVDEPAAVADPESLFDDEEVTA